MNTTPEVERLEESKTRLESLYRWTKRTQEVLAHRSLKGLTFDRLYNLMRSKRLTTVALDRVLKNDGARTAGVDGITKGDLNTEESRARLVDELNQELCVKTYKPQPVRRTYIPKANGEQRPLGIPTIKDRVVQEMLRLILEPIYEARFYPHSYGFRPFRSTHHAALRIKDLIGKRHYNIAIEGDIRKCFDRIHHLKLLKILRRTIRDERIIRLVKDLLKAGVMEDGAWQVSDEGTPQGGIVSPLLANIYLNELDWFIHAKWGGFSDAERQRLLRRGAFRCFIVRYADDFVVMVKGTMEQAMQLKAEIADFLETELHLELSEAKTLITPVEQGIDFLGFRIRKYQRVTLITPSPKAMSRFREKVKQRVWEGFSTQNDAGAIEHLNKYLVGWAMYYRRVSSSRAFRQADHYVWWRVFRTSHRLRNPKLKAGQHYKAHYIPYRYDIRRVNRKHRCKNYGCWADKAHTTAYIVVTLNFFPIRYVSFHPQLNPYVPEERAILEKRVEELTLPPNLEPPGPMVHSEYGSEWSTLRKAVLEQSGYRCWQCGKPIRGRKAHVHHCIRLKSFKNRRQAHFLENLVALCPGCHQKAEWQGR